MSAVRHGAYGAALVAQPALAEATGREPPPPSVAVGEQVEAGGEDLLEEPQSDILAKSTSKAVLVSGLTTMVGFGSLMVAQHHGIASHGRVMALGTGLCLVASLAFLPAALDLLDRTGSRATVNPTPA